jgi:hypothetical protein
MTRTVKGKATKGSALVDYDKCTNGCGLQSLGNSTSVLAYNVLVVYITTITLSERGLSGRECPAQLSKIHRAAEPGLEMA